MITKGSRMLLCSLQSTRLDKLYWAKTLVAYHSVLYHLCSYSRTERI